MATRTRRYAFQETLESESSGYVSKNLLGVFVNDISVSGHDADNVLGVGLGLEPRAIQPFQAGYREQRFGGRRDLWASPALHHVAIEQPEQPSSSPRDVEEQITEDGRDTI